MRRLSFLTVLVLAAASTSTANALVAPELPSLPPPPKVPTVEPPVELPPVQAPSVHAPLPKAPSIQLPAAPAPSGGVTESLQRTSPSGTVGSVTGGLAQGGSGTAAGSGAAPEAGAPANEGGDGSGARARPLRGDGVEGSRHRTARALVRALSGCLDQISPRGAKLLILRFGVGGFDRHPSAEVARMLDLPLSRYDRARRRALRQLVREARQGSCERDSGTATVTRVMFAGWSGGSGGLGIAGALVGSPAGASGDELEVLGASAESSSADGASGPGAKSGQTAFPREAVVDDEGFPIVLALLAALAAAGVLWVVAGQPALAAAERRRAYRKYLSGPDR